MASGKKTSSVIVPLLLILIVGGVLYYLYDKSQRAPEETMLTASEPEIIQEEVATEESSVDMAEDGNTEVADGDVVRETEVITFSEDPETEPVTDNPIHLEGRDSDSLIMADGTLEDRAVGEANAPVTIIEYSSLTCSHCASFHTNTYDQLKENYIDTGKVRMIFREFPLNKPALDASQILRCMPEDKYFSFQDLLFETQEQWAFGDDYLGALKQNAKLAGMSEDEFNNCLDNEDLQKALTAQVQAASQKWEISSTPTFIINDGKEKLVGAQPYEMFETKLNSLLGE